MSKKEKVVEEVTTENKEVSTNKVVENNTKTSNNIVIVTIIVVVILALLLVINFIMGGFGSKVDITKDIKDVKKILNEKYNEIDCVDSSCDYVVATTGNSLKKTTYTVFNINGKKIAKYTLNYSKKGARPTTIVGATDKYIITRTVSEKKYTYTLRSTKGKSLYSSSKVINDISSDLVVVESDDDKYTILDSKGKTIYSNVDDYDVYADGKYISIKIEDNYTIIDEEGEKVLSNHKISTDVTDEDDELLYLVVEDVKKDNYYYFDINKNEKVGDSFSYYTTSDKEGELIITKTVNDDRVKYILTKKGKQEKISDEDLTSTTEIVAKLKEKVDTEKYYLYSYGIKSVKQDYVFVNDRAAKTFGILNLKNKEYKKLFDFKQEKYSAYASISELDNKDDESIVRINCSKSSCNNELTIVYNLSKNKVVYSEDNKNAIISDYVGYKNNYKVVKYSYLSSNAELKGNYVLYDKNNKEVLKSETAIVIVDSEIEVGKTSSSYIILYSVSDKKTLNSEKTKADRIKLGEKVLYKYTSKDNKTVVCNDKGEKVIEIESSDYITYSNLNVIYMSGEKIYIYNAEKDKTRNYKLKDNEKLNDESNDIVSPYRGAIFVNNSSDKMVKVVNSKGNVIRKIKGAELSEVKKNRKNGVALIIVKKNTKDNDTYGLYIAK